MPGTYAARFDRYFVAPMRWISPAYLAPYLSRTGCVALKNASLSAGTNLTPAAFSLAGLGDVRVPQLALLELRLARELLDQVLVGLRQLVPAPSRVDEDLGDDQVAGEAVDLALPS